MLSLRKSLGWTALLCLVVSAANAQFAQQGPILFGSGGVAPTGQGNAVALSTDGNTAIVGGYEDNNATGAAWVFTRSGGVWSQQGAKLVGTGAVGQAWQGGSVALSADGNTALIGGLADNNFTGAVWVSTRSNGIWSQQGDKLVGSDPAGGQGYLQGPGALSADGNTAVIGDRYAPGGYPQGGAYAFTRSNGVWKQGPKLAPTVHSLYYTFGPVALSADGNTALIGGITGGLNSAYVPTGWVFVRSGETWSQQGGQLIASNAILPTGNETSIPIVALSHDGNTALMGWPSDSNFLGAAFVFTRSSGAWTEQAKLVGSGSIPDSFGFTNQGDSVALSGDGNTALIGGNHDNGNTGAAWVFHRSGDIWSQVGDKLAGTGESYQGSAVALSGDAYTALVGVSGISAGAFVFVSPKPTSTSLSGSPNPDVFGQAVTFTAAVTSGATGAVTFTVDGVSQSTVPLTGSQAKFTISNLSPGTHTVTASYSGDPTFAASTSNVVNQTVTPLGAISMWQNTVVALDKSVQLPLTVPKPVPAGGLTVYLTSSDPAKVTVTPSVFIPSGRTSANVQAQVKGVQLGTVHISAAALGYTPDTQTVRVTATLAFTACCEAIFGRITQSPVLTLSSPAPSGGLTVNLSSDNTNVVTVPATITFPPNATSVIIPIVGVGKGITLVHASALPDLASVKVEITVM